MTPHVDATVLAEALIIEAIGLSNLSALVIASNQCYLVRVAYLQCKQQEKCFNRVKAAVNKIPHEKIVCPRTLAADPEEFHQVVKLAVDVATNLKKVKCELINLP